jgi:ribosomal protein S18 acetylase RimI-like enzyme
MPEVVTQRLGPGDEHEVERFAEAFDDPVLPEATRTFLGEERHHLIVAYVDGHPAGFVSAVEVLHPDKDGPELFLNEIGVIERFRRHGAASALLDDLKRLGWERGCRMIWVLTDEGNPAAMALYAKAGGLWDGDRHVMFDISLA